MKNLLVLVFIGCAIITNAQNVSLLNIRIGDPEEKLKNIKLPVKAQDEEITKYETSNGNDFSITCVDRKVIYMENDWLHQQKGQKPLVTNFKFGITTLAEIRKKFGTNGFVHTNQTGFKTETDVIMFNCFELDNNSNEVLVIVTKALLDANIEKGEVANLLKLESIIITSKAYLNKIWGEEKSFDPNYKKVKL